MNSPNSGAFRAPVRLPRPVGVTGPVVPLLLARHRCRHQPPDKEPLMVKSYIKLDELAPGDRVLVGGFTCVKDGSTVEVQHADDGLWFRCSHGRHYLSGQLDTNGDLVGLWQDGAWEVTVTARTQGSIGIFAPQTRTVRAQDKLQARQFAMQDCRDAGLEPGVIVGQIFKSSWWDHMHSQRGQK